MRARPVDHRSWPADDADLSAVEITRAVLAVVMGYVIFAGANFLFFALSGRDPHSPHEPSFILVAAAVGALYSALAGYTCVAVAGRAARGSMLALAALMAIGAAILLLVRHGEGAIWSQLAALFVFTPAALAGGAVRGQQMRAAAPIHHDRP